MDGSDNFYQTAAHEAGHIMIDTIHAEGPAPRHQTELMFAFAAQTNAFNGPKRLCDNPLAIRYLRWTAANNQQQFAISAVQRLRTKAAPIMEAW